MAAKNGPYTNPVVSVTLNKEGGVEGIVFKVRSGTAAVDAAIEIIIQSLAPYKRLPPDLALDYDVVEVTRQWSFSSGLRLTRIGR